MHQIYRELSMKSDTVDRKFIETFDIEDYEVLTDSGWKDIESVGKTVPYEVWQVCTKSFQLMCADDHILFNEHMEEVLTKDLKVGDFIQTEAGIEKVEEIQKMDMQDNMYDVQLDNDSDHRYYTNGILSHNSTIYCIFSLWLATFFPEKKIMILANKLSTALELLGRVQLGYSYLPKWLKSATVNINKGELTFSNMSSIRAFASSSDAARGFSANCIFPDTKITIRLFKCNFLKFSIKIKYLKWLKFLNFI